MATISTVTDTTMFQIRRFLGLNENDDGDTRLKLGEAAEMRNWRITGNGSLQVRPGTEMKIKVGSIVSNEWVGDPIQGMWYGLIGGAKLLVIAAGGKFYTSDMTTISSTAPHVGEYVTTQLTGTCNATGHVEFFQYNTILYAMDGTHYMSWDGTSGGFSSVAGYVPTVMTGVNPTTGAGTAGEQINLLSSRRKCIFSPTNNEDTFMFDTFSEIVVTDYIKFKNLVTGIEYTSAELNITVTAYQQRMRITKVKITPANPATNPLPTTANSLECVYTVMDDYSSQVKAMKYWEFYNGANDNRVFLYGDGSNTCIYSGITSDGHPTAEYFPAMNVIDVGEKDTPITGLVRHFSYLVCFKTNCAYSIKYDSITLEDGTVTAGFYITPVNRSIGNIPLGQVKLIRNNPYTLQDGRVYEWVSSSSGSGAYTYDERQARPISARTENTLKAFSLGSCYCYDDNYEQEYYICYDDNVLVYNYENSTWYYYTNLRINCIVSVDNHLYFGMADGSVRLFTRDARGDYREDPTQEDDGIDGIDAFWRSGSLSFDRDWKRKYSMQLWVGLLPENNAKVTITASTDRRSEYYDEVIYYGQLGFGNIDFNNFTFGMYKIPNTKRAKLKVKKYTYYQLFFECNTRQMINDVPHYLTSTVLSTDIQVRYASNAK